MVTVLLISSLACQIDLGGPTIPSASIPTSEEASAALQQQWQATLIEAESNNGNIQLVVDETQLTSFLRSRLNQQEDPILDQPTIRLQDGLVQVYGYVERSYFRAPVLIEITVNASEAGDINFEIDSAQFGPLPMPSAIKDSIANLISEALAGSVGPYLTGLHLDSVSIADGEMAVRGELR